MPKSILEETSQRLGMTTRSATTATTTMERYVRWWYAGVPQSSAASRGGVAECMSTYQEPIRNQAEAIAWMLAKILHPTDKGFTRDCMGSSGAAELASECFFDSDEC